MIEYLWIRIESWLSDNAPSLLRSLLPPVSEDELKEFEKKMQVKMPADFVESLKVHNGQSTRGLQSDKGFGLFGDTFLLELDEIHNTRNFLVKQAEKDKANDFDFDPLWVPFARTRMYASYCLDTTVPGDGSFISKGIQSLSSIMGASRTISSPVISCMVLSAEKKIVFGSFRAFLHAYVDELEAGLYEVGKDGRLVALLHDYYRGPCPESKSKASKVLEGIARSHARKSPYNLDFIARTCEIFEIDPADLNDAMASHSVSRPYSDTDVRTLNKRISEIKSERTALDAQTQAKMDEVWSLTKECLRCRIELTDDFKKCPVCNQALELISARQALGTKADLIGELSDELRDELKSSYVAYQLGRWRLLEGDEFDKIREQTPGRSCKQCNRVIFDSLKKCPEDGGELEDLP
jgi:Protein involved in beta-1,3-glucan synthesis